MVDRAGHIAVEDDSCLFRQVVGQCGRRLEEERQVVLDAAGHDSVRNVLVQVRFRRIAFEDFAVAAAKACAAGVIQRKFTCRQEPHFPDGVQRALRIDVERLDALDFVVEKIDAIGQR